MYHQNRTSVSSTFLTIAAGAATAYVATRTAVHLSRRIEFRGKSVLITGGSRGLGLVLAREFADAGARVVICSRNAEQLKSARRDLREHGAEVMAVVCDVTSRAGRTNDRSRDTPIRRD